MGREVGVGKGRGGGGERGGGVGGIGGGGGAVDGGRGGAKRRRVLGVSVGGGGLLMSDRGWLGLIADEGVVETGYRIEVSSSTPPWIMPSLCMRSSEAQCQIQRTARDLGGYISLKGCRDRLR